MLVNPARGAVFGAALGAMALVAPQADAAILIDYTGVGLPSTISAQAQFTFTDVGGNVQLSLQLTNDSTVASRLVAFGFDLPTGQYSSIALTTAQGWNINLNDGVGGPFGNFTLCIESDNNGNCAGNNPALGIVQNALQTFIFTIDTALTASAFETAVSNLYGQPISGNADYDSIARFQAIGTGDGSDRALPGQPTTPNPAPVPEPATLALFGAGLFGLGALARRRRRA